MTIAKAVKPPIKPGYTTTEFWVTVFTDAAAVATDVFHKHVGINIGEIATAAAGLGNITYGFLRTKHKADYLKSLL